LWVEGVPKFGGPLNFLFRERLGQKSVGENLSKNFPFWGGQMGGKLLGLRVLVWFGPLGVFWWGNGPIHNFWYWGPKKPPKIFFL